MDMGTDLINQHTTPQRITAIPQGTLDLTTHRPDEVNTHISFLANTVCCRDALTGMGPIDQQPSTTTGKLYVTTHRPDEVEYHTTSPTNDEPIPPLGETATRDDPQQTRDYAVSETNDKPLPARCKFFLRVTARLTVVQISAQSKIR